MLIYGPDYLFDSTASSILGLFSVTITAGFGTGGRQLKVPVPRDDLVPFGETIGSATTHHGFVSSLRPPALSPSLSRTGKPPGPFQALHPGTLPGPYLPGPAWARRPSGPLHFADKLYLQVFLIYAKFLFPFFEQNRQATPSRAIPGTPPRHPTSGTLFPRPRLGSPAVRATSLRRQALFTSLPHLRQVFYSSLLHEHEHRDRGPPFSTVQPPRRSLMQTCPHRRPLPAVGFARARPSGCVRPTWSRSTFSFLFFVWFVLFPDLNASLPLLFTGGYRSHPTKESFCARSSPRAVSGPRPLLLLNIMT